jgi:hypothetical protein
MDTPLDANETKVLQELRLNSLPGFALLSKTGLNVKQLIDATTKLRERMLLRVTGELSEGAIGEVDLLLGNLRSKGADRYVRR